MCSIFAWAGEVGPQVLEELFINGEMYGRRSAGLAYVDKFGVVSVDKDAVSPTEFVSSGRLTADHIENSAWRSRLGFGHTRAPTHGKVCAENAHPFEHSGIVFAHNGIVTNHREFGEYEVDSQALGPLIDQRRIGEAAGSIGLVWLTPDGQLYCYRSSQYLTAKRFWFRDELLTLVVSRDHMIPVWLKNSADSEESLELVEGVAYKVSMHSIVPVFRSEQRRYPFAERIGTSRSGMVLLTENGSETTLAP